jgi:hypothetical protein
MGLTSRTVALAAVTAGLLAAGIAGAAVGGGHAATAVRATLDARAQVPRPAAGAARAAGVLVATLNGRALTWRLTLHGLTGPATGVHLHLGRPGKAGPVALKLCACPWGGSGRATLTAATATALRSRGVYVDAHTAKNPRGEVRGQVALGAVPTLQLLDLRDGGTIRLPLAVRYSATGFRIGPGAGRIVALTNDAQRPTLDLNVETPGVAYLPDDKMLTGKRNLTFVLSEADGTQLTNREARVTVYDVTIAGRR